MGYGVYERNGRFQGYSVPAFCDHSGCLNEIDRGMGYACCENPNHTQHCGGFYCEEHRYNYIYEDELEDMDDEELEALKLDRDDKAEEDDGIIRCNHGEIEQKEHPNWVNHVEAHESWSEWRLENPTKLEELKAHLKQPELSKE